jgi:23S rRNA pseudouridine1911/1915/1917 synthase
VEKDAEKNYVISICAAGEDQRIDAFLASRIEELTRSRIQELIGQGAVTVNDALPKPSYRLRMNDRVVLCIPPARPSRLDPEPVPFEVVYEDPFLVVLNKPPGVVVHPAPGHATGTLVHGLLHRCPDLSGIGGALRPGIVHRLDKDTSGLMVVAKRDAIHRCLAEQFKSGGVSKGYLALVHGIMEGRKGTIDLPIARHPVRRKEMSVAKEGGRQAVTHWEALAVLETGFSLLSASPQTGRTHQIRVHLCHVGHPIAGDSVYGRKKSWWRKRFPNLPEGVPRQMLHAERLGFVHPENRRRCAFKAPMPEDMRAAVNALGG